MEIRLTGRNAILTGAAAGLGRSHALALARHGARIVVNDVDGSRAEELCSQIAEEGGEAFAHCADVTNFEAVEDMVGQTVARWGGVDILVNNAGILRDRTFAKMGLDDFRLVIEVHLMGTVHCTKAVWGHMRDRGFGRIVCTTSSSGLYGNFGQSNYGAAKMAIVGLMKTLALEGRRHDIRINCLAPSAATGMTQGLYDPQVLAALEPDLVSPAVLALVSNQAPTGRILLAGAGSFEEAHIGMTQGILVGTCEDAGARILRDLALIGDRAGEMLPASGPAQFEHEFARAREIASGS